MKLQVKYAKEFERNYVFQFKTLLGLLRIYRREKKKGASAIFIFFKE